MKPIRTLILLGAAAVAFCQAPDCDLSAYQPAEGLRATVSGGNVQLTWQGEQAQSLRAVLSVSGGRPVIRELAVRPDGGTWAVLATNLVPEAIAPNPDPCPRS